MAKVTEQMLLDVIKMKNLALKQAGDQFLDYARLHEAKTPPDAAKAETNHKWAQKCYKAAKL